MSSTIDISYVDHDELLVALLYAANPAATLSLQLVSLEEAKRLVKDDIDSPKGHALKAAMTGDEFDPTGYDAVNGAGAAWKVVSGFELEVVETTPEMMYGSED
jgi:hypothetical protein